MSQDNKPFNLAHAKAGAPVQLCNGKKARIICFNQKAFNYPLVVLVEDKHQKEYAGHRTEEGKYNTAYERSKGWDNQQFDLVMAPLAIIEGKPVFVGDIIQFNDGMEDASWHDVRVEPDFSEQFGTAYRWPRPTMLNIYEYITGSFGIYEAGSDSDRARKASPDKYRFVSSIEKPTKK